MANLSCPSTDLNFLSPNGFLLNVERLPKVNFFCQQVGLPGVSLSSLEEPTPLSTIKLPSERLEFEPLVLSFAVDGQMSNWLEVFGWMRGLGFPENNEQYSTENLLRGYDTSSDLAKNYSDARLVILGANNTPIRAFNFIDCFPISLSGIQFDSQNNDVPYVTASLTLEYSYYKLDV
jgi:hypothetical protein